MESSSEMENLEIDEAETSEIKQEKPVKGPLSIHKVLKFKEKQDRTGVVYISRVPPYMKPEKVRHLLSQYGEVLRIYLSPEDPAIRKKRKMMGGNKRQSYVDGWVEFADKKVARKVAEMLNTRAIGGKQTSFYSSDLWSLKYLSKFKWHHLTEKISYDNAVRKHKLQTEIAQGKRERDFYLEKVEQSKRLDRKAKSDISSAAPIAESEKKTAKRVFRQITPLEKMGSDLSVETVPPKKILSKIFGASKS